MALITLKSRKDPIDVPNDKAKTIKARWGGLDVPKASSDDIIDLGWISFTFGQLKTIEITPTRKTFTEEDYDRPLTLEEKQARFKMAAEVRKRLEAKGIFKPKIGGVQI